MKMLNLSPFFSFVLIIDHHLPTNKMPLFSNTAISVFDEKFPGSGLVFDSLSLDIRCYKTVQVLEREASNSGPSEFLSPSLPPSPFPPSLHSQVTNPSNNPLPSRPSQIHTHNRNHVPNQSTRKPLPQRLWTATTTTRQPHFQNPLIIAKQQQQEKSQSHSNFFFFLFFFLLAKNRTLQTNHSETRRFTMDRWRYKYSKWRVERKRDFAEFVNCK